MVPLDINRKMIILCVLIDISFFINWVMEVLCSDRYDRPNADAIHTGIPYRTGLTGYNRMLVVGDNIHRSVFYQCVHLGAGTAARRTS